MGRPISRLQWLAWISAVVVGVVVAVTATREPGYYCGGTYGTGARCLDVGDELPLLTEERLSVLGFNPGSASVDTIRDRALDIFLSFRFDHGEVWPIPGDQAVYCLSEECEWNGVPERDGWIVITEGRLVWWHSIDKWLGDGDPSVYQQRDIDAQAARAGGYDCSDRWGAGFVCHDAGDVIDLVREHGEDGAAITIAGNTADFSEDGNLLEFSFGARAALYDIGAWLNCMASACTLVVRDTDDGMPAGEVLAGVIAVLRTTPRSDGAGD